MLPHLRDRPVTLLRCPDGVGRECFFQKHGGEGMPEVVPRVNVRGEDSGEEPYVYIDGLPALMALVQLNVLEFHVWNSRVDDLEHPARVLAREQPERYTARLRGAREGRIFIDYLRNGRNANQVAAYSTRARPGATVSVPLRWDELRPSLDPSKYDVRSVARRVRALSADPWEGFEEARAEITVEVVERLTGAG